MDRLYETVYSRNSAAAVLLLSPIMLLSAGLHNVAKAFASVKLGSSPIVHWGSAVAIELGVVALGLAIAVRARAGQRSPRLQAGVLLFVAASMFANYDSSLQSLIGGNVTWQRLSAVDAWTLAKAGLLGGALPLMVLLVIEALRELARETTPLPQARPALHLVPSTGGNGANDEAVAESPTRIALTAPQGARDSFLALLSQEPSISPTEVSRRLSIGRATVYRWKAELGVERRQGQWVVS
ncbi:MAG: hypothetical protein IT332_02345 [Ardenticatenales bacterium]|nr:hypothetical protein [Ardenticatenales bacterium]